MRGIVLKRGSEGTTAEQEEGTRRFSHIVLRLAVWCDPSVAAERHRVYTGATFSLGDSPSNTTSAARCI